MSFRSFWVASITLFLLFSCSNTGVQKPKISKKTTSRKVTETIKDGEYYLAQAKQSFTQNQNLYQRNSLLISAAEAFQKQELCQQSIKILDLLQTELNDNRLKTQTTLILAECLLTINTDSIDVVEQLLENISPDYGFIERIYTVKATFYARKKEWLTAASFLQKTTQPELDKSQKIWSWISKLNLIELQQASLRYVELQPWLQLAIINHRFALNPQTYQKQIVNWQSRHIHHPLVTNLPNEVSQVLELEPISPRKIAVLFPLSGRLASQGLAIKKGLLASYLQDLSNAQIEIPPTTSKLKGLTLAPKKQFKELRFFDSALKTAEELNTIVTDFDVVIGPLIKKQLTELQAILPRDKILLGLNRLATVPDTTSQIDNSRQELQVAEHYYYSLAPEDEAEQLAQHIHKNQLVRPIIFAADNSTTQRMAEAFINQWSTHPTAIKPELSIFKNTKEMRAKVSSILDVAQSKNRIRQIEYLADVEVIGVERNRRDIDAVVLFATPEQTELLNPIIEASLSPFAKQSLSVFASSRSYSKKVNQNSLRDLRNLTFTDMPWMLPKHNWRQLSAEVTDLWPQNQDSLQRLFAMGVDAYNILSKLRTLKLLPQIKSAELTGKISVGPHGVIRRHLPLAQVTQSEVKLLAMD